MQAWQQIGKKKVEDEGVDGNRSHLRILSGVAAAVQMFPGGVCEAAAVAHYRWRLFPSVPSLLRLLACSGKLRPVGILIGSNCQVSFARQSDWSVGAGVTTPFVYIKNCIQDLDSEFIARQGLDSDIQGLDFSTINLLI